MRPSSSCVHPVSQDNKQSVLLALTTVLSAPSCPPPLPFLQAPDCKHGSTTKIKIGVCAMDKKVRQPGSLAVGGCVCVCAARVSNWQA